MLFRIVKQIISVLHGYSPDIPHRSVIILKRYCETYVCFFRGITNMTLTAPHSDCLVTFISPDYKLQLFILCPIEAFLKKGSLLVVIPAERSTKNVFA